MTPIRSCPATVCVEISRPFESNARPFDPFEFSRNVETFPSLSIFDDSVGLRLGEDHAAIGKRDGPFSSLKPFLDDRDRRTSRDHTRNTRAPRCRSPEPAVHGPAPAALAESGTTDSTHTTIAVSLRTSQLSSSETVVHARSCRSRPSAGCAAE